jgi:hypothetical protein
MFSIEKDGRFEDILLLKNSLKEANKYLDLLKSSPMNLNFQRFDSDALNIDKNKEGNIKVLFLPRPFLKTAEGSFFELNQAGKKVVSYELALVAAKFFLDNSLMKDDLEWKEANLK